MNTRRTFVANLAAGDLLLEGETVVRVVESRRAEAPERRFHVRAELLDGTPIERTLRYDIAASVLVVEPEEGSS